MMSKFDVFQSTHVLETIVCGGDVSASAIASVVDIDQPRWQLFQAAGYEIPACF
jgi:hypothetical protein